MEEAVPFSEFLEVVRLSLEASNVLVSVASQSNDASRPSSPERQRLINEILFSRHFVLTYYGAIGALVLPFIIAHWYKKVSWVQRKRKSLSPKNGTDTPTSQSSAGSGWSELRRKEISDRRRQQTEATPLLDIRKQQCSTLSTWSVLRRHTRAFLMAQPEPLPAMTAPSNLLPPYGIQMAVLLLLAINVFYLFYHVPLSMRMLFVFADRAGLCFVVNLPVLYVLAAKTNQPLQYVTGWSYEGLNLFHRRLGEWMIILAALHGAGMMGAWYTVRRPLHFTLLMFLSSKVILLGIAALVAYLAIYLTSVGWFRKLYYELFLTSHIILQVAALAFLYFHFHLTRPYVLASSCIWLLDRVITRICISSIRAIATLEIAEDQKTVLLFCDVPLRQTTSSLKTDITHGWSAGQHVFVSVPGIGWKHRVQAHPFTIASPAPHSALRDGLWPLQLTIRAQDGFSRELLEYARFHQHAKVYLDGPYGSLEVLEAARAADRVCFIAGGSGIAVTYPVAYDLQVHDQKNALSSRRRVYQNGQRQQPSLSTVQIEDPTRFAQMWIRQDSQSDDWIKYVPNARHIKTGGSTAELVDAEARAAKAIADLITSRHETAGGRRPDIKTELEEWIESGSTTGKVVFVVSGPDGLVRDVRNGAAALVRAGYDIDVHVEKFGW